MKNAILSGIRQGALSRRCLLGAAFFALILLLASMNSLMDAFQTEPVAGFHGKLICDAMESDAAHFFVPILSTLPFAARYVEEIKSKYARSLLYRSSRAAYLAGKIAACFASGGLVLVLGILIAYALAAIMLIPMEAPLSKNTEPMNWFQTLLPSLSLYYLSGGLWALVGMTASTWMESRYIAYAAPFVLYYVLIMLYERYFPTFYVLDPRAWLLPSPRWIGEGWGAALLVMELSVVSALIFSLRAGRRFMEI